MADAGIRQEALKVRLRQRREIAVKQGSGSQKNDRRNQPVPDRRQTLKGLDDPEKNDETNRLRTHREKCGDRSGSTLVDIGDPKLERSGGDFESETDEDKERTKKNARLIIGRNRG